MGPATAWQHTIHAYPILFAAALSLFLAVYSLAYRRRVSRERPNDDSTLIAFAAMNVAIAVWTGFSALKLLSVDPGLQFQAYRLLYFGSSSVGPLLLLFVLAYTDRTRWVTFRVAAGLFAVPTVFWILLFTNPHDVVIAGTRTVDVDGVVVLRTTTGPAHVALSFTYAALIAVVTLALVAVEGIRRGRPYLPQTVLLSVAIAAPIVTSALTSANVPPFTVDAVNYVPVSTVVSSLALGVATFRYRFLDLRPIAYRTIVDDSPDGVIVLDAAGRVVHVNATVASLLGEAAPTVGERLDDRDPLVPVAEMLSAGTADEGADEDTAVVEGVDEVAEDVDAVAEDVDGTTDGVGTGGEVTLELAPGTGAVAFLDVRSRPLRRRERHLGWVVVLRDVTTRRRRERDLETFTGVISHDLRAPLRTTERYLDLLESQAGAGLDDEASTLLAVSRANSRRGREMVTDLLEYSRVGAEDVAFEPVDCGRLVSEVVDALRYRIDDRDAAVHVENLPTVHGVDHLLRRLFQNLIANALEHAGPAPTITVTATREVSTWRFVVRDDGVGIDPKELEHALDPFTQGAEINRDGTSDHDVGGSDHGADIDPGSGTGMGLAICVRIVDRHGGELTVDSTPGEGTVVEFTLPADPTDDPFTDDSDGAMYPSE